MKDELPSPHHRSENYERPNQKWVCGWLRDGHPCPHGPNGKGHCGAVPDCFPARRKDDDGKEVFVCTRSKELGGPCAEGPGAEGICAHPPLRCRPRLSLRARRGRFTVFVALVTLGALLFIFYGSNRWQFISPGELSSKHQTGTFLRQARDLHGAGHQCGACHTTGKSGPAGWIAAALRSDPAPHQFTKLLKNSEPALTRIDAACQTCHPSHTFHEPNVAWEYSCSACHAEHRGSGLLHQPDAKHCVRCHGDAAVMQAAAKKGQTMSASAFDFQIDQTRHSFKTERPTNGYTQVIHEFSEDHPEFQIHAGGYKVPNTLRFSHATHIGDNPNMPLLGGKKLHCAGCHQPGPGGLYQKNVAFNQHCKACHEIRFDPENPTLVVPHGDPAFAQAFLRSLPQQFANFATREKGLTTRAEIERFVQERIGAIRNHYGSGEELEEKIFFNNERVSPTANVAGLGNQGRSLFPGCAYCHEIKRGVPHPTVTKPMMPERWLSRGRFDHSKHTAVSCSTCHTANTSENSTDLLIGSKQTCASCHRPQGPARNDCLECHSYHHRRP